MGSRPGPSIARRCYARSGTACSTKPRIALRAAILFHAVGVTPRHLLSPYHADRVITYPLQVDLLGAAVHAAALLLPRAAGPWGHRSAAGSAWAGSARRGWPGRTPQAWRQSPRAWLGAERPRPWRARPGPRPRPVCAPARIPHASRPPPVVPQFEISSSVKSPEVVLNELPGSAGLTLR